MLALALQTSVSISLHYFLVSILAFENLQRIRIRSFREYVLTRKYLVVAPLSTDERGPCPGLNAAANHGFIPHNGIVNTAQSKFVPSSSARMITNISWKLSPA